LAAGPGGEGPHLVRQGRAGPSRGRPRPRTVPAARSDGEHGDGIGEEQRHPPGAVVHPLGINYVTVPRPKESGHVGHLMAVHRHHCGPGRERRKRAAGPWRPAPPARRRTAARVTRKAARDEPSQAWAVPSVGWPAKGSSADGVKIRPPVVGTGLRSGAATKVVSATVAQLATACICWGERPSPSRPRPAGCRIGPPSPNTSTGRTARRIISTSSACSWVSAKRGLPLNTVGYERGRATEGLQQRDCSDHLIWTRHGAGEAGHVYEISLRSVREARAALLALPFDEELKQRGGHWSCRNSPLMPFCTRAYRSSSGRATTSTSCA